MFAHECRGGLAGRNFTDPGITRQLHDPRVSFTDSGFADTHSRSLRTSSTGPGDTDSAVVDTIVLRHSPTRCRNSQRQNILVVRTNVTTVINVKARAPARSSSQDTRLTPLTTVPFCVLACSASVKLTPSHSPFWLVDGIPPHVSLRGVTTSAGIVL